MLRDFLNNENCVFRSIVFSTSLIYKGTFFHFIGTVSIVPKSITHSRKRMLRFEVANEDIIR